MEVLKATGKDFGAFKKGIAARIFKGKPDSLWYDAWMSLEEIPARDDSLLELKKLDAKGRSKVRAYAARIAERKYGESEVVAREHLANDLIRLACWQTRGSSVLSLTATLDDVSRVLFRSDQSPRAAALLDPDPLDPLLCA